MQYAEGCMQKEKMVSGKNYQDLIAWQKAMDLVEMIYEVTKGLPKEELYGLTAQLRRAAVSIPSNIAEGQGRTSGKEFQNFLSIAHGSVREVETQILITQRLGYLKDAQVQTVLKLAGETGRLIKGLLNSLSMK
jgi:four helix bundle protein